MASITLKGNPISTVGNLPAVGARIQRKRWQTRLNTGFDPRRATIPRRFREVVTWKGGVDETYLEDLMAEYAKRIMEFGNRDGDQGS